VPNFNMIVLFLTSLGCSFDSKLQQTNTKKRTKTRCLPIIYFTFVWNNDTPRYAHCVRFGGI